MARLSTKPRKDVMLEYLIIGALSWFTRHTYTRVFTKLLIHYFILEITSWCSLLINCSLLLVQPATTISYISRTRASLRKTDNGT